MPRLASNRLAKSIQARTVRYAYGDTASYLARTSTSSDAMGQPVITTTTTAIECSFTDKPALESWRDYGDIGQIDAEIRFASPAPSKADRITLTGHFDNAAYVDRTFEIIGIRDRGEFGYVCALRAVVI